MSESFEFLASAEEWERSCLNNSATIDKIPEGFKSKGEQVWTFPAQLLATLNATPLKNTAQNGDPRNGNIGGYPRYVRDCRADNKHLRAWKKLTDPAKELLDALPMGCLLLKFDISLDSPFYSRDDMPFYPTDNALKRQKVFDSPYLAASGIKGLLHWASRMRRQSLEDDDIHRFLFGSINESRGDGEGTGMQGALFCYPLYFSGSLGLEVINPQDRESGAGSVPVKYEVVKPGATGTLYMLLANLPGREQVTWEHVKALIEDLAFLLEHGGLSAKSSAGWGRASLTGAQFAMRPRVEKEAEPQENTTPEAPAPANEAKEAQPAQPQVQLLFLHDKDLFEAVRDKVSNNGNLTNPNKRRENEKLWNQNGGEAYLVLGLLPEGRKLNKTQKENVYKEINARWQSVLRKPYEEIKTWVDAENAKKQGEAEARAEAQRAREAEKLAQAAQEEQKRLERERRENEERQKARWSSPVADFQTLKKELKTFMEENGRQDA